MSKSVRNTDLLTTPDPLQSSSSMMCITSLLVGSKPSSVKNPLMSAGVNTPLPPWSTCHIRATVSHKHATNQFTAWSSLLVDCFRCLIAFIARSE